jgi:methylthioribose-1-phosphate isomerase
MMSEKSETILRLETVQLKDESSELVIIDQTLLPGETVYRHLQTPEDIWEAIHELQVRGAPAIGIAAAYGLYLCVRNSGAENTASLVKSFRHYQTYLGTSRPTAVNLFWAMDRMKDCLERHLDLPVTQIIKKLKAEADQIKEEDIRVCRSIGEHALTLTKPGMGLLTHCNAGQLATARYGTALAPMYLGQERGYQFKVYADETRPLLQGARLTAFELHEAGIDVTLICDNMAASVMEKGWVQAVFTGCDRVAANGDTANKIGTSGVAILASHYGIPFYICAPTSTIDMNCTTGSEIVIEERAPEELTHRWYEKPMAPKGVKVYNPAFDVTNASLITAIVTEYGILYPPYEDSLKKLHKQISKTS